MDFSVIHGRCRIAIELKRLSNSSPKGVPPIPSYRHGLERQLPNYAYLHHATHAIYITAQHYTSRYSPKSHDDNRALELQAILPDVEKEMKKSRKEFKSLHYINIDVSPKQPASNI